MKQCRVETLRSNQIVREVSDGALPDSPSPTLVDGDTCWANSTITAFARSSNSSLVFFFCFFSVATMSVSGLLFQS